MNKKERAYLVSITDTPDKKKLFDSIVKQIAKSWVLLTVSATSDTEKDIQALRDLSKSFDDLSRVVSLVDATMLVKESTKGLNL